MIYKLYELLTEFKEVNKDSLYEPVAVGKYGIRKRNEIYKKDLSDDYSKNKVIRKNNLIIGMGSNQIDVGVLLFDEVYSVSPAYHTYRINTTIINSDYLELLFKAKNAIYFKKYSIATARQGKKIDLKSLLSEEIDVPSFEEQENIVSKVKNIENLISKEDESLDYLDELTKSRFNELFMHNGYPKVRLEQLSSSKGEYGAGSASAEFDDTRPRYVRITDINDDGTLNDDYVCSKILTDDNEYKLKYGDFLFARMGATVGKTYAFLAGNQIYAGYLIRYRLILSKINPIYLFWYTRQNEYWDWVRLKQSGSAQPGINAKKFDSLEIPLAPIDKQNQFALFVEQADKLKFSGVFQQKKEPTTHLLLDFRGL